MQIINTTTFSATLLVRKELSNLVNNAVIKIIKISIALPVKSKMPQLTKRRKAAIERHKIKKLRNEQEDPLAWTFQNPWRCGFLEPVRTEPVNTEASLRTTDSGQSSAVIFDGKRC